MSESCPLPPGRDCIASAVDWNGFVKELLQQWRLLWRARIDDKVRAEGIASNDFELLFVDRGTVIIATRCFKQLDFKEILREYNAPYEVKIKQETPLPHVGGWRKFGRKIAASHRIKKYNKNWPLAERRSKKNQQMKQGGRGWLHTSPR